MPVRYFICAAAGAAFALLFVLTFDFAEVYMQWLMVLLALIGGAKLGAGVCYLFDMMSGDAPDISRPPHE
jgi:hypothetical protein